MRRPLSVVGTDQEALSALLTLHACPEPRILDVTHNRGRMWSGLPYAPHRSDLNPELLAAGFTDTIADFRALPFEAESFDVIVFDPPHLTHAKNSVRPEWVERYGLDSGKFLYAENVCGLFAPFFAEAQRVLVPGGMVLAKMIDVIHSGRYQWQHRDLLNAGEAAGFTGCDLIIRMAMQRAQLVDPKWKRVCHVRQVHTYWLALRNGPDCISPTAPRADVKPRTGEMFVELTSA